MKIVKGVSFALFGLTACQAHSGSEVAAQRIEHKDIVISGCPKVDQPARKIILSDLSSDPDRYHGAAVRVDGYYYSYFEHSAIYPAPIPKPYNPEFDKGIWLLHAKPELNGEHVRVIGIFSSRIKGHLGQWPGSICVTSIAKQAE